MARVLPVVVGLILAVYALIDCLQTDSHRIRALNKPAWLAIIILVPVVGPILWLVTAKSKPRPKPIQPPPPQVAPDDDPEFLRQLRNIDDEHEKLLNDWEDNLRRREDELRKEDGEEPPEADEQPERDGTSAEEKRRAEEELRKRGDGSDDDSR